MKAGRLLLVLSVRLTAISIVVSGLVIGASAIVGRYLPPTPKLAFMGGVLERDGTQNFDIFVMDYNRHLIDRVTWAKSWERFPAWSPDGHTLAFHSGEPLQGNCGVSYEIYLSSLDGQQVSQLTGENMRDEQIEAQYEYAPPRCNAMPTWSPDGKHIAFHSNVTGDWNIFSTDIETGEVQQLTHSLSDEYQAAWSPDGSLIAYTRTRQDLIADNSGTSNYAASDAVSLLYLMDANGHNEHAITNMTQSQIMLQTGTTVTPLQMVEDNLPTWSPDGSRIAFTSTRNGSSDLYIVDVKAAVDNENNALLQLTNNPDYDSNPVWISNEELVYTTLPYTTRQLGIYELYKINVISGERTLLISMSWEVDGAAWWSPST